MRQAGTIATQQDAERFSNYLLTLGITSKVEPSDGQWAVWIHDENQIPRSRQELEQFQLQPNHERYTAAEHVARQARREAAAKKKQAERNFVDMRNEWAKPWHRRPVTLVMIIFSVIVFLADSRSLDYYLFISTTNTLGEVRDGQVWRLVSPIFLHFSFLHILFNMYWLFNLGTMIERHIGSVLYVLLILAIALPSNYTEFVASGPGFGGMSGVVYGLFGYAWVRGRLEPNSGLYLPPNVAFVMIVWFVLCTTPLIGNVANWAHGGGLVMGALLAYLSYNLTSLRKKT